ncbi:HEPN domain-containing protein [Chitinophaga sp. 22536]|uniref:HEPN domain-containing protein n=1 Tax=unclassified Chitinophaga TaxID=2619133 RepID=UPI003F831699
MRPFNLYTTHNSLFQNIQPELVRIITGSVSAELIYLLGSSLYQRRTETIFNSKSPASHYTGDYFLLVVIRDAEGRRMGEWEDILEQRCGHIARTTIIVTELSPFVEKYSDGNIFATSVHSAGTVFYDAGNVVLPELNEINMKVPRDGQKEYKKTVHRVKEFLAGADLYIAREESEMASFMIHQAFEQCLKTLVLIGSGFVVDTHNIDRLLRYAGLVTCRMLDLFPVDQADNRKLLETLQKAYIGARYAYDFTPPFTSVVKLREKAQLALSILIDAGTSGLLEAPEIR